jgi:hypothetical protein
MDVVDRRRLSDPIPRSSVPVDDDSAVVLLCQIAVVGAAHQLNVVHTMVATAAKGILVVEL